jgi:carbon-monoxide dehydrogenase large subunit
MSEKARRLEDPRLLSGRGRYTADVDLPGQAHAAFVRSPRAHAKLRSIDVPSATSLSGVLAILNGDDVKAAGIGGFGAVAMKGTRGSELIVPHYPVLAQERVRYVGQPVAVVVAETAAAAQDAAEALAVTYEELPCVTDVRAAVEPGAPRLHDNVPGNVTFDFGSGDAAAVEQAFARAAHVTRLTLVNQRLIVCAMEPRAALASYDAAADKFTLYSGSQGAAFQRDGIAAMLKLPKEKLRLITGDVGGGFGMKTGAYPEYVALLMAARRLGRPVKWVGLRNESFMSDNQGRDMVTSGELALDADGKFLALRIRALANGGAYCSAAGAHIATSGFSSCVCSVYATLAVDIGVKYVLTNTLPVGPYRGAGRPEAAYIVERLVEQAARETGRDAIELRRRNLIPTITAPYKAANGAVYDSGEFEAILDKALATSDPGGFEKRKKESASRGRLRGRGLACYLEIAAGAPVEFGGINFVDGRAELRIGGGSTGQGHETAFPRLLAERLGIPMDRVRFVQNDTDLVPRSMASVGSRSSFALGNVAVDAATKVIDKGLKLAAHRLEASAKDIEYGNGMFRVSGTDRSVSLWELAAWACSTHGLPEDLAGGLDVTSDVKVVPTYPNGCHVAEVEIDPETGVVYPLSYLAVDDCGRVYDHTLVDGQLHGGIVQGLGQVLIENGVYDAETGQLLTGSFMDYGLPRADMFPHFQTEFHAVPATTNALGVKGAGEAGTTGALPTVVCAILDALRTLGVEHIEVPATPNRVWRAIAEAKSRRTA